MIATTSYLYSKFDKFNEMFKPHKSFIVGDGGISIEDFMMMDLTRLFLL